MKNIEGLKAIGKQIWPDAEIIDIHPGAAGLVSHTGPDPQGFRFVATNKAGQIIWQFTTESLVEMHEELQGAEKR